MKAVVLKDITKSTTELPIIFLRRKAVEQITGLSKSSLYQQIKLGEFPAPVPFAYSGERDRSFRVSVTAAQRVVLRA